VVLKGLYTLELRYLAVSVKVGNLEVQFEMHAIGALVIGPRI